MTIRSQLTEVDFHCFLLPAIRPFLIREEIDIANQKNFMQSLRKHVREPPMSRRRGLGSPPRAEPDAVQF